MHPEITAPETVLSMRLSRTQADLLTDMGITVWLSRSAGPLADDADAPGRVVESITAESITADSVATGAVSADSVADGAVAASSALADQPIGATGLAARPETTAAGEPRRTSALKPELVAALSGAPASGVSASTDPVSGAVPVSSSTVAAPTGAVDPARPRPPSGEVAGTVIRGARIWGAADAAVLLVVATPAEAADATVVGRGRPGPLLTAMLASIGLAPEQVAVAIAHGQGEPLGAPRVLLLGEHACQAVLGMELTRARARAHVTSLGPVVATDHPDALRRHAALKRLAWDDLRVLASLAPLA